LITFTSSTTGDATDLTGSFLTAAKTTTATDSQITVNSTSFVRSSNVINDVIDGVTLNLFNTSATAQMVNVSRGSDNSETVIKKMIDTYNDLITTYKTMTANSYNSEKPGTFANDPTTLAFINEIKARFAKGITYGTAMTSSLSMASIGIDLQIDGVLKFNALTYLDAQAAGLQDKLAQGVTVGYVNSTNNLKEYIDDLIGITGGGGSLTDVITTEKEQIGDLFKRQTLLQDKLIKVQNTLVTQYSALNSLLYQLSVTSNSLTSALDALSNNNKN
jgi:flagellar hook-associated protein 2